MRFQAVALVSTLLTAGCVEHPPGPPNGVDTSATQTPPAVEASEKTQAPRQTDPEPEAVQAALEAALKIPVVLLGRQPMHMDRLPHVDFVVFKAEGEAWCSSHLPLEQRTECLTREGVTWAMREVLGFAVVAFEDPAKPYVSLYRFVGESSLIPKSFDAPGVVDSDRANNAQLTRIELEELVAADVDNDGQEEYVARVSHGSLITNFEEGPQAVYENFWHKRLLVFRADLSLEADGYVHQIWDSASPAWAMDDHRVNEKYTFEKGAIVLEWCELWHGSEECPIEVACKEPTERITIGYDASKDNYSLVRQERLRPPVGDVEWDGDTCLGPVE